MKSTSYSILLLLVFLGFSQCKSTKPQESSDVQKSVETFAQEKYGSDAQIDKNRSKTFALVSRSKKATRNATHGSVHFFIYDLSENNIIHEGFVSQGSVEWLSDEEVKVNEIPGRYREGVSKGYIYNVKTQEKKSINI